MNFETFSVGQWNLLNYERAGDFEARYERVLGLERVRGLDVFFAQEVVDVDLFTRIALSNGFKSVVVGSPVDAGGVGERKRVAIASKTELEPCYDLGFVQGAKTVSRELLGTYSQLTWITGLGKRVSVTSRLES